MQATCQSLANGGAKQAKRLAKPVTPLTRQKLSVSGRNLPGWEVRFAISGENLKIPGRPSIPETPESEGAPDTRGGLRSKIEDETRLGGHVVLRVVEEAGSQVIALNAEVEPGGELVVHTAARHIGEGVLRPESGLR